MDGLEGARERGQFGAQDVAGRSAACAVVGGDLHHDLVEGLDHVLDLA